MHRLASQRADQHDAHLTALSAVANTTGDTQHALFLDVAATIAHFYPRIDDIQLVPLDASEGSVGIGPLTPVLAQQVREAAIKSDGQLALLPYPEHADHYMLVKRSPNTDDARYGLMLGIDAGQLLGEASPFWSKPGTLLQLSMPGGHVLVSHLPAATEAVHFSKALASASQPLALETGMTIEPGDLFPPVETVLTLMLVSAAYIAVLAAWRQRVRTRAAVEQARLSALESRLAHASRVNALGEMASGLAHELTQPLTAILAEAQACRRMLSQGGSGPSLTPVLEDTIAQAKRASSILERFRNWSRPQPVCVTMFDLRDALDNVRALLASQAASCNARLTFNMPATIVPVKADPVEMEQVVFNLVRNGLEAVATQDAGQVTVTLRQTVSEIILDVSDNGPGVAPELRDRLFTPFTTNRPDGTGLGLTLSQRLIERANGDIFLVDEGPGATFRIILKTQNQYMESTP
ncbi:sensor histidine kinase [Candidimonas nitroreducens]|uniref:sensor histidine kinase n=1 Tax=Candidimonas nitroreducens TaxID=683354 RepID=UPI001E340C9D|nr:ATP-binding protein [Candidimonas nitroreducens]